MLEQVDRHRVDRPPLASPVAEAERGELHRDPGLEDDLVEGGLSREEALIQAHREFGNVTSTRERGREVAHPELVAQLDCLRIHFIRFFELIDFCQSVAEVETRVCNGVLVPEPLE